MRSCLKVRANFVNARKQPSGDGCGLTLMLAFRWACPNGSTTGSYQGPPATSGDEGLCPHFIGLVLSRNPAAVVRKSGGSNLEGTLSLGI
jgi:hypothetical protein